MFSYLPVDDYKDDAITKSVGKIFSRRTTSNNFEQNYQPLGIWRGVGRAFRSFQIQSAFDCRSRFLTNVFRLTFFRHPVKSEKGRVSGPKTLRVTTILNCEGVLTLFNVPRPHGRSEDSTIENKVIQKVKLKKPKEMSRRIDLHRSTKDCKFRTPRSLLTFSRASVKREARTIGMLSHFNCVYMIKRSEALSPEENQARKIQALEC